MGWGWCGGNPPDLSRCLGGHNCGFSLWDGAPWCCLCALLVLLCWVGWHFHLWSLLSSALAKGCVAVGSSLSAAGHDFNHVYGDQFSTSKQTSVSGIYITFEKSKSTELRALLRGSLLGLFGELLQIFYILLETSGSSVGDSWWNSWSEGVWGLWCEAALPYHCLKALSNFQGQADNSELPGSIYLPWSTVFSFWVVVVRSTMTKSLDPKCLNVCNLRWSPRWRNILLCRAEQYPCSSITAVEGLNSSNVL